MKKLVIATNMYQERDQYPSWFDNMEALLNSMGQDVGDIIIVDSGSTDGSIEYANERGAIVVVDDIIKREGYGPARNHLRQVAREHHPDAVFTVYFDADERIDESEFHQLRWIKDYLDSRFDVIAFPRIDWMDDERSAMAKDVNAFPDFQARMTKLDSPLRYVRSLHEGVENYNEIYANITTPKINHFHRSAGADKRRRVGKLCSFLHMRDEELGNPEYPMHPSEEKYRKLVQEEGLD